MRPSPSSPAGGAQDLSDGTGAAIAKLPLLLAAKMSGSPRPAVHFHDLGRRGVEEARMRLRIVRRRVGPGRKRARRVAGLR